MRFAIEIILSRLTIKQLEKVIRKNLTEISVDPIVTVRFC